MFDWITNFGASRVLSLLIAAGYLSFFLFAPGPVSAGRRIGTVLTVAGYLLLPVLCIWFGDEMGSYTGRLANPAITKTSPGCAVKILGWVLLFAPIILLLIMMSQ